MTVRGLLQPMAAVSSMAIVAAACRFQASPTPEEGRALYLMHGCASCHGPDGHGDGPVARTLVPRPRDFRDAGSFKNGTTPVAISKTIAEGIPGGAAMPLFGHLTERERGSLALYVTSLREPSRELKTQP